MRKTDWSPKSRPRPGRFWWSMTAVGAGGFMMSVGLSVGLESSGNAATGWGVLAGSGLAIAVAGAILAWLNHPAAGTADTAPQRDRLQGQRVQVLAMFSIVNLAFLPRATGAIAAIASGAGELGDFIFAPMPVLYAWLLALTTLGWDHHSRTHRKFMEDELTQLVRARAISAAFVVLMAGLTVVFGLGLWRPELTLYGVVYALTAAGATAGLRFVWLDREFGKDG